MLSVVMAQWPPDKKVRGFHWPAGDACSSGHLVLSHLGLAFVLMLGPFFPGLVMSTDLLSFEHPAVLLFCFSVFYFYLWIKEHVYVLIRL